MIFFFFLAFEAANSVLILTSYGWRSVSWSWWSRLKHLIAHISTSWWSNLIVLNRYTIIGQFSSNIFFWPFFFFLTLLNRQSLSQGLLFPWNVFEFFFFPPFFCSIPWKISSRLNEWLCVPGILLSVSTQMHWIACTASHEMPFWPMPSVTHWFHLDRVRSALR